MRQLTQWMRALLAILMTLISSSCISSLPSAPAVSPTGTATAPGRTISGEEALQLYGIQSADSVPTSTVLPTSEPWLPIEVWVSASILPYGGPEPIRTLSVYSDKDLELGGYWLGDLREGDQATLRAVSPGGYSCFVEGQAVQGWPVRGWAACSRLLFFEPTLVPWRSGPE